MPTQTANADPLILLHVPKTAGTSLRKAVFERNLAKESIVSAGSLPSIRNIRKENFSVLHGHFQYGVHRLLGRGRYATILRDPVERAISFYYFIRDSDPEIYCHPLREVADARSLTEFYSDSRFANWQTRFLAGWVWHRLATRGAIPNSMLLHLAREHLKHFAFVGIQDRFQESARRLAKIEGLPEPSILHEKWKATNSRPLINDLSAEEIETIRNAHRLDYAIYEEAVAAFDRGEPRVDQ